LLKNQPGGARRGDDRRVISGILYMLKSGCRGAIAFGLRQLRDFRRVATRYDKLALNFLPAVVLAAIIALWI
jgi:transposase